MRNFAHVLIMWGLCNDRELLEWRWNYEYLLRKDPRSRQCETVLQDFDAINQTLHERNFNTYSAFNSIEKLSRRENNNDREDSRSSHQAAQQAQG